MQKQIIPAGLALILALSAGSSYAPANPPDNQGCPPLERSGFIPAPAVIHPETDRNGDGWICMKVMQQNGQTKFLWIDNRPTR